MSKTAAARLANAKKATALEADFVSAFKRAPREIMSNGQAARWLADATRAAPASSITVYLRLYRQSGEASRFHREYAVRAGPQAREYEARTGHPPAWINRSAVPAPVLPGPAKPAPRLAPKPLPGPVEPEFMEPAKIATPRHDPNDTAHYPEGNAPLHKERYPAERRRSEQSEQRYNPFEWRYS